MRGITTILHTVGLEQIPQSWLMSHNRKPETVPKTWTVTGLLFVSNQQTECPHGWKNTLTGTTEASTVVPPVPIVAERTTAPLGNYQLSMGKKRTLPDSSDGGTLSTRLKSRRTATDTPVTGPQQHSQGAEDTVANATQLTVLVFPDLSLRDLRSAAKRVKAGPVMLQEGLDQDTGPTHIPAQER